MEVGETELLQELFSFPLVSHVEVEEKGILYLEAVTRWCASNVVGCSNIQGAGAESRLYWIKEENNLLPATKLIAGPFNDTLENNSHLDVLKKKSFFNDTTPKSHMFVTPLVQHGPSSTKRPRLIPAISPDEGRENSPTRGGDSSPAGESPGGKQCNSSTTEEKLKDMSTVATSGEQMMELVREKRVLEATLKIKEEQLRKLKMVQVYRTKKNLEQLDVLISKWREVSQEAAELLLAKATRQPCLVMHQLLDHLHIDHALIHYSSQDESFY